ncbi:unnamed protein product [Hydatigera taeniaeformis]|uniref:UmuC domain-containing protein n=1 Tax=Hydatigena taeniaeformis TaxID=6205 RepID=A0A0R3X963_HYDTA|nr:unnamed protein product [Hydatigera taeniaeformis]
MRRGAILKEQVERKAISNLVTFTFSLQADKLLRGYSAERRFDRCIVHIDMDAFYAAVEMRDDPSLRLRPLAVGSQSMLSTSNYLARRFGVRAAMPGFLGIKLCPQLTIVPPDFVKYTEVSRAVRSILGGPTGLVVMSLDEVYLNISKHLKERIDWPPNERTYWPHDELATCLLCGMLIRPGPRLFGTSAEEAVREMRFRVFCATRLTCSAGQFKLYFS